MSPPRIELDPLDEDTVEMVLSPRQIRRLEQVAAQTETASAATEIRSIESREPEPEPEPEPSPPPIEPVVVAEPVVAIEPVAVAVRSAAWQSRHYRSQLLPAISLPIIAIAAVIHLSALRLSAAPASEPAMAAAPLAVAAMPAPAATPGTREQAQQPPPPVRFVNPFDRSEVFEFPAGTSRTEARDAVAGILENRARARLGNQPGAQ